MIKSILTCMITASVFLPVAFANESASMSTPDANVYFISPTDGQTVDKTFQIQFGLSGMGIAPAGVQKAKTGHHHLLIDTDINKIDLSQPLPATKEIKHFGGGQTETSLSLPPGKHTLQLLLGNHAHIPHNKPVVSKRITVRVK